MTDRWWVIAASMCDHGRYGVLGDSVSSVTLRCSIVLAMFESAYLARRDHFLAGALEE